MFKTTIFAACLLYTIKGYTQEISRNMSAAMDSVAHNLAGGVQINGRPMRWSLTERMEYYKTPAVSIAVIQDSKILWSKAYGWADKTKNLKATTKTRFQAASMSKPINALAFVRLAEQGKVDLFSDINAYLRTWKFPYDTISQGKIIHVANLLSHTAGLSVHGFRGYHIQDTLPTLIEVIEGKKPANSAPIKALRAPSEKFEYSGGGTTISQLVLQEIVGEPYSQFMERYILTPLHMCNSSYRHTWSEEEGSPFAVAHVHGTPVDGQYRLYPEQAAAGLWTTPEDLARYVIELQNALNKKTTKLISHASAILKLTPYQNPTVGLGDFVIDKEGQKYFTHGGINEGFVGQYVGSFDGKYGAVVMTNGGDFDLVNEILNSIAITYKWPNYYEPERKDTVELSTVLKHRYIGQYRNNDRTVRISLDGDTPYLQFNDETPVKIYFTSPTSFFLFENRSNFMFVEDEEENVFGLKINETVLKRTP